MRPRVSVLLPARDARTTLPAAIGSLRRQTLSDWECVIVDDGSSDGTREWLCATARSDPRLKPIRIPRRGLVVFALNLALERAQGAFVARMDADDVMHPERLAAELDMLDRDPTLAMVGCHVKLFPARLVTLGRAQYARWLNSMGKPEDIARDAFVECPVAHPTWMARRAVLTRHRYREVDWPEDYDVFHRLLAAGLRVGVVPRPLLLWRESVGRLSRSDPRYSRERFVACKASYLATGFLHGTDRYVLWGHGPTGRSLRRALADRGCLPSHIVEVHPRRLGQVIGGVPVIAPADLTSLPSARIVTAVAGPNARSEIRARLEGMGRIELVDFVCTA